MSATRRQVLKASAAIAAFSIVPRHVLGGPNFVPPSRKVNVALIGAGGQGRTNIRALMRLEDAQVMAVADPMASVDLDRFYYKGKGGREEVRGEVEKHYAEKTPNFKCAAYEDFRQMLEKEKAIDAVLVATPDHLHAYVSIACMRAGKHVYCEKPLTHNVREARLVAQVAKETGVATQLGNQGHSSEGMRQTVEYIRAGAIGRVNEVHAWVGAQRWNPGLAGRPADSPPVPEGLNWDLWLGPREPRPYHPAYVPVSWRDFWAFGNGTLGDFGCHDLDAAVWALDLRAPTSVEGSPAGQTNEEIQPYGELVHYRFPRAGGGGGGGGGTIPVTWYGGGLRPPRPDALRAGMSLGDRGVLFVGEKGVIQCGGAGGAPRLFPDELRASFKAPEKSIPRSRGHHQDWLDAARGGAPASSNFEYGARLTEIVLLGVLAVRLNRQFEWDPAAMTAKGAPEAEAILRGAYRKGWEV